MERNIRDDVSAVIEDRQPVTPPEIAAILETHPRTVQRHCKQLQQSGRVRQVTGGGYVPVDSAPTEPQASD